MKQKQNKGPEPEASHNRAIEQNNVESEAYKDKSKFLANMSHELRTPLNSLLVLSELLAENEEGNLTNKQVEFAETIHACGSELLALINDILDLAKIESGKVVLELSEIALSDLKKDLECTFRELARCKRLDFRIEITERAARSIFTDGKRLNQLLKNLLANALKFTDSGSVLLLIDQTSTALGPDTGSGALKDVISFAVSDTGIGIAKDKQKIIFDPFEQADDTTSRKYGGTGLGLTISRDIATLIGGQLEVESELGTGSTFTLHLPVSSAPNCGGPSDLVDDTEAIRKEHSSIPEGNDTVLLAVGEAVADDRPTIRVGDVVVLIIEQNLQFACKLQRLARERGFKTLITGSGEVGFALAQRFLPQAITLDMKLADGEGWTILEHLRRGQKTRRIPVQLVSIDQYQPEGTNPGAKTPEQQLGETSVFLDRIQLTRP